MSKIGRRPIDLAKATVSVEGSQITIDGPKGRSSHQLPPELSAQVEGVQLVLSLAENANPRKGKMVWGLHRALLANKVQGVTNGFSRALTIVGLGYKAQKKSDRSLTFSLGFSHKIEYSLPEGVSVDVDKTGQKLTFSSQDKFELGNVCAAVRALRPPEPYKGTGIMYADERILRKAGKARA